MALHSAKAHSGDQILPFRESLLAMLGLAIVISGRLWFVAAGSGFIDYAIGGMHHDRQYFQWSYYYPH